jgi:hypothetical protein
MTPTTSTTANAPAAAVATPTAGGRVVDRIKDLEFNMFEEGGSGGLTGVIPRLKRLEEAAFHGEYETPAGMEARISALEASF